MSNKDNKYIKPNIELIVEVGFMELDLKVARCLGETSERAAISLMNAFWFHSAVDGSICYVPEFIVGTDAEYYFLAGVSLSASNLSKYNEWKAAFRVLPFLRPSMHYTELLELDGDQLKALLRFESLHVEKIDRDELIDGFTSGHHRDIETLLSHALHRVQFADLSDCWVYMDDNGIIDFEGFYSRLNNESLVFEYIDMPADERQCSGEDDNCKFCGRLNMHSTEKRFKRRFINPGHSFCPGFTTLRS